MIYPKGYDMDTKEIEEKRWIRLMTRYARYAQIYNMKKEGATYQEIANTFKVSRGRAHQLYARAVKEFDKLKT